MMTHRQFPRRSSARPQHWCAVLLILLVGAAPMAAWAGGRIALSGSTVRDDIVSGGGAAVSTATHLLWGAVGQAAVGQSFAPAGGINHGWPTLDKVPPVITRLGAASVNVECNTTYTDAGATAVDDNDGDITPGIVTVNPVNTSVKGSYTVTYNVTDAAGNAAAQVTRTVNVVDTLKPLITRLGAGTITIQCGSTYTDSGATATDSCDGDLTSSIVKVNPVNTASTGVYTVTYNVSDGSGNAALQVTRTVNVTDTTNPVALCRNITVPLSSPTITPASVDNGSTDNCGITSRLINGAASRTFSCANLGANVVTLRVLDAAGNFATCAATVTVVDDIAPVAVCRNVTVNLSSPTLAAASINNGSTDNCGVASLLIDGAASRTFTCADLGPNTVTLSVLDNAGNAGTCQATVTVVDNIAPAAACKNATVYLSSPTLLPADIDNGSSDNCAVASMLVNGAASLTYTAGDVGVQSVTLRVSDAAGLSNECTAQVTVVDDTLPEGEGEVVLEGEGEPPVEGEGELPVEGEGEPIGLQVTANPTHFTKPEGGSVNFAVTVTGAQGTLSYQWYRISEENTMVLITDANAVTYTIPNLALEDAGRYQCEVYDNVLDETAWSPVFVLVVIIGVPAVSLIGLALASALTACAGISSLRKRR